MENIKRQHWLAITWLPFMLITLIFGLFWGINNYFESQTEAVIKWLAQSTVPYFSLIIAFYYSSNKNKDIEIGGGQFILALILSICYFCFIGGICYSMCKNQFEQKQPLTGSIDNLSYFITFFQTSLAIVFTLFFSKSSRKNKVG